MRKKEYTQNTFGPVAGWCVQDVFKECFVPELVSSRQDGDGAVPDVACVVNLAALHLHLGVLEPERDVAVVHVQRSLVDGSRPDGTHRFRHFLLDTRDPQTHLCTS